MEGNLPQYLPRLKTVDHDKETSRGGRWRTVATDLETERLSVRGWADLYCEDKSTLKEYVLLSSMHNASCIMHPTSSIKDLISRYDIILIIKARPRFMLTWADSACCVADSL